MLLGQGYCAYIEYFAPNIILLDEPDSHIHPTKQKSLALELVAKTKKNEDLKIVCSTHSRYILEALDKNSNVMHFQDGKVFPHVQYSSILLDIGAADADYLFQKKNLRYVIATEDKVDNIAEKKDFLKNFLIANGLSEDEFVLHSYEGCKNVHFAKVLEGFVRKHIPTARVILHIDRDQKIDGDREILKLKQDCSERDIRLFVTKLQEIESYFCTPEHITEVFNIPLTETTIKYNEFTDDLKEKTIEKLINFVVRDRGDLAVNKSGHFDIKIVNKLVDTWYAGYKYELTLGKELMGKVKNYVQQGFGKQPNDIAKPSKALNCAEFQALLNN
jgi:energy-coupling factor transporter ATP-binding protein EcfA2